MELDRNGLVLFHDYTKGHCNDLSENGYNGVLTNSGGFIKSGSNLGYRPSTDTGHIAISAFGSQLNAGCTFAFRINQPIKSFIQCLFSERTTNDFIIYFTTSGFLFYNAGTSSSLATSAINTLETVEITLVNGAKPKFYGDGVYLGEGTANINLALANATFRIGYSLITGSNAPIRSPILAMTTYSVVKTPSEITAIHAFLMGLKSPSLRTKNFYTGPSRHAGELGMVSGWNMVPNSSGKIADVKSVNHGTPTGVLTSKTPWGESCLMLPQKPIACGAATNCGFVGKTYGTSKWICVNSLPTVNRIVFSRGNWATQGYEIFALTGSTFQVYEYNGATQSTGIVPFALNRWYQLGMLSVNGGRLFIATNGALVGAGTVKSFAHAYNAAHPLVIGGRGTDSTTYADITLCSPSVGEFASQAEFEAYFKAEYNRVASSLIYRENFESAPIGYTALGSGTIPGTDLEIIAGTAKIVVDTVDGKLQKVLQCVSNGQLLVPIPPGNECFGTLELKVYSAAVGGYSYLMTATNRAVYNHVSQYGYGMGYGTSAVRMLEVAAGGVSWISVSSAIYPALVYRTIKLTRSTEGVNTMYVNNVLADSLGGGSNPVTDITTTTARFLLLVFSAGDKVALIQKKFGVFIS